MENAKNVCQTWCFPVLLDLVWERTRSRSVALLAGTFLIWKTVQAILGNFLPASTGAGGFAAALSGAATDLFLSDLLTFLNFLTCVLALLATSEWHALAFWLPPATVAAGCDLGLRLVWDLPALASLRGRNRYFAASTTVMEAAAMLVLCALLAHLAVVHRAFYFCGCCSRGGTAAAQQQQVQVVLAQVAPPGATPQWMVLPSSPPPPSPQQAPQQAPQQPQPSAPEVLEEFGVAALWASYRSAVHPTPRLWMQPLSLSAVWASRGAFRAAPASLSALLACVPLRIHFGALVTTFVLLSLGGQLDGSLIGVRDILEGVARTTEDPTVKFLLEFLTAASTSAQAAFYPALVFALGCVANSLLGAARDHVHVMGAIHAEAWAAGVGKAGGDAGGAAEAALRGGDWEPGAPPPPYLPPPSTLASFSYLPKNLAYAAPSGLLLPPEEWPHEVPDVAGEGSKSGFLPAFKVPVIFIALHLLSFAFLMIIFIVILFLFLWDPLRDVVINVAVTAAVSAAFNSLFHCAFTWALLCDGAIRCPRVFLAVDTIYSLSVGLPIGVTISAARLGVGLAALAASLPAMHKPGARDIGALAARDGVFSAYMGMLRCKYLQIIKIPAPVCCEDGAGCFCKGKKSQGPAKEEVAVRNPLAAAAAAAAGAPTSDAPGSAQVGNVQEWPAGGKASGSA
jgi:hypothetical protein